MVARNPNRDRFYDLPPVVHHDAAGVTRHATHWLSVDEYRGTREALAAAGLLPLARFPGMPGQNEVSAALWPRGCKFGNGSGWASTPGHLTVTREATGKYRIRRVVDADELERRRAAQQERATAAEGAAEAVLQEIPAPRRRYLEDLVRSQGTVDRAERWFRDPEWLARERVDRSDAEEVLRGLEVFRRADIERDLILRPMQDAASAIDRARGVPPRGRRISLDRAAVAQAPKRVTDGRGATSADQRRTISAADRELLDALDLLTQQIAYKATALPEQAAARAVADGVARMLGPVKSALGAQFLAARLTVMVHERMGPPPGRQFANPAD